MSIIRSAAVAAGVFAAQLSGVVPSAAAAADVFAPEVGTVVLHAGATKVTSSTDHRLRAEITATHPVGYQDTSDVVAVTLRKGSSGQTEQHQWSFTVPASAWGIDSSGAGAINVPTSAMSPYGKLKLTVGAVGDSSTESCNGTIRSQTQKVSVKGTFFFDTRSKGSHKWGSVGSKTKRFTFSGPSTFVTTDDLPATPCVSSHARCVSEVVWSAATTKVNVEGVNTSSARGSLITTRHKSLSSPAGATRTDEVFATTKHLAIKTGSGGAASLAVVAVDRATGTAKLTATESSDFSVPCRKDGTDYTQTYTSWDGDYTNGSKPLTVRAQIFGSIKLDDVKGPGNASFSTVTYA